MKPLKTSVNEVPRVTVVPDEGKIFEAIYVAKTYYGESADFVEIERDIANRLSEGEEEALEDILIRDSEKPPITDIRAGKVQLNCLDGIVRYIANKRISEVYDYRAP